jgi:hypothetical protein
VALIRLNIGALVLAPAWNAASVKAIKTGLGIPGQGITSLKNALALVQPGKPKVGIAYGGCFGLQTCIYKKQRFSRCLYAVY